MMNHSSPFSSEPLALKSRYQKSIDTLRVYDDLEENLRESGALILSLLTTDFVEDAEPNKIKDYIRCLQKNVERAQVLTDQFGYYLGHIGE